MKNLYLISLLFLLTITACKKDRIDTNFDKSYEAYLYFKKSSKNSYSFIAYGGSVFGYYAQTKLTVTNGKVSGREYTAGRYKPNTDSLIVTDTWVENSTTLNTHQQGFESLTLDQVYDKAKSVWLKADKKENDIYFEAGNNGLISSAGYVPIGCQDDCFTGVNIKEIRSL